jgi:hypothetical protein
VLLGVVLLLLQQEQVEVETCRGRYMVGNTVHEATLHISIWQGSGKVEGEKQVQERLGGVVAHGSPWLELLSTRLVLMRVSVGVWCGCVVAGCCFAKRGKEESPARLFWQFIIPLAEEASPSSRLSFPSNTNTLHSTQAHKLEGEQQHQQQHQ